MLLSVQAVAADSLIERPIVVPGPVELKGTLTLPADGKGPFPGIVLVQGSGASDRDESIGPNKPFRDLAHGLAERGVAVLRYDKRIFAAPTWFIGKTFTVWDEMIQDAVSALKLLRSEPEIDLARVFVLGHSLGGWLAPRIAAADGQLAGAVIMSGAIDTSLIGLTLAQLRYISSLSPADSARLRGSIQYYGVIAATVDSLTPADSAATTLIMGATPSYWLDLRKYHAAEMMRQQHYPLLILQGERDYQVTPPSMHSYVTSLADRPGVTVREFPGLNHLMMIGTGPPSPADYQHPGHVSQEVVTAITKWIGSISGSSVGGPGS